MIRRDCPTVLVVSPPCTAFSIANQGEVDPATLAGATEMIRFAMEVCDMQRRAG
jgi:site-specific DNA-cytosine methylase